jgi:hypothetical protein
LVSKSGAPHTHGHHSCDSDIVGAKPAGWEVSKLIIGLYLSLIAVIDGRRLDLRRGHDHWPRGDHPHHQHRSSDPKCRPSRHTHPRFSYDPREAIVLNVHHPRKRPGRWCRGCLRGLLCESFDQSNALF